MSQDKYIVHVESVEYYGKGESAKNLRPADFILTNSNSWTSKLIYLGQKIRYRGKDAKYAIWDHAALITNAQGDIIQAIGKGVKRGNVSDYRNVAYHLVRIRASGQDREEAVKFAEYALGEKYGYITVISIAISFLTGLKLSFGFDGQQICSGLVARALERTTAIFSSEPSHITPADLAKYYKANPTDTNG